MRLLRARRPSPRARQRGQALVEFALVAPSFLLLLFGLIDGGRLVYLSTTVSQAAREGARLASTEAGWIGSADPSCNQPAGPVCPPTTSALVADVVRAANRMMTPFASVSSANLYLSCDASTAPSGAWTGQTCASPTAGGLVSIRVVYAYSALTPGIAQLLGSITLSGSATMVIN